jgi:hypothetical protein
MSGRSLVFAVLMILTMAAGAQAAGAGQDLSWSALKGAYSAQAYEATAPDDLLTCLLGEAAAADPVLSLRPWRGDPGDAGPALVLRGESARRWLAALPAATRVVISPDQPVKLVHALTPEQAMLAHRSGSSARAMGGELLVSVENATAYPAAGDRNSDPIIVDMSCLQYCYGESDDIAGCLLRCRKEQG